jgi:toxin YoeB
MFEIEFTERAKLDIEKHKKTGNKSVLYKILTFLEELTQHPFTGTGKPEPLKYEYTGYYSRRINKEHRLIYRVTEKTVYINSAYGHYL